MSTISPFVGKQVIVRTQSAGVFYGTLTLMAGDECILAEARRIWYWAGAASLSQLSAEGTKCPGECKFPRKVESVHLLGVVEVLPLTREAFASLEEVEEWSASTIAVSCSGYGAGDVSGSGDGDGEGYDALYGYEYIAFSGEGDDSIDDVVTFSGEGDSDGSGYVSGYGYVSGEGYGDRFA